MGKDETYKQQGIRASSAEFSRFDQVAKPDYHLAEVADTQDVFDEDFRLTTCDLGRFLHGDEDDKAAFANELGEAMAGIGFAILEGHGLAPQLFRDAEAGIEELFQRTPLEDKLRFRAERHGSVKEGYFPMRETSDIHPDLVEGWVFGRRAFDLNSGPDFDAGAFWPDPKLEPQFRPLVQASRTLFLPVMQSILRFLGNEPHLFDERLRDPNFGQRLNFYPAMTAASSSSGAGRLLGHEDVDLFTLLPAPKVEGLQALDRNGKWVRLNAPVDSIILNTGDYMQRLSNDRLPSTTHRVSPPRNADEAQGERVSFPLAAYLKPEEILEVLPGLGPPKYDPIRVITFHTRTTAKFYGDDYAVEMPV